MNRRSWIVAAVSIAVFVGCGGGSSIGGLDVEATYAIPLTTAQVVPAPKPSSATGAAELIVFSDHIDYQIAAQAIAGVTSVHIHTGAVGAVGASVVTLFSTTTPITPLNVFSNGRMLATNLPQGVTLESMKALLASGNAYVDVHTTANTAGELRGQITD